MKNSMFILLNKVMKIYTNIIIYFLDIIYLPDVYLKRRFGDDFVSVLK
jgi:hypothetical protein